MDGIDRPGRNAILIGNVVSPGVQAMSSDRDTRQLNEIGAQLERESPRLARRLRRFDRDRVIVRLGLAAFAGCAGTVFTLVGAGPGTTLFGLAVMVVAGWEVNRRFQQLRPH